MSFPVEKVRADFPVLTREVNGLPLAYLDSAASAQKSSGRCGASRIHNCVTLWSPLSSQVLGMKPAMGRIS